MREVLSNQNADGWFRDQRPMIGIDLAIAFALWTPLTVVACKFIADA